MGIHPLNITVWNSLYFEYMVLRWNTVEANRNKYKKYILKTTLKKVFL